MEINEDKLDLIIEKLNHLESRIEEIDDDIIENNTTAKQFGYNLLANLAADVVFTSNLYTNFKNNLTNKNN